MIAVLDDDMSPDSGWVKGVLRASGRNPGHDLFSGRSHVIWPDRPCPGWARSRRLRGWVYSVSDSGPAEWPMTPNNLFSGNHFWFRAAAVDGGERFAPIWLTEPAFLLDQIEAGRRGLWVPDAVAGHRVQPELLDAGVVRRRARILGSELAEVRLRPFRSSSPQAARCRRHPVAATVTLSLQSREMAPAPAARQPLPGPRPAH